MQKIKVLYSKMASDTEKTGVNPFGSMVLLLILETIVLSLLLAGSIFEGKY